MTNNAYKTVQEETFQHHSTRKKIFTELEEKLDGRKVVALFTSFSHPVQLTDDDCDLLQSVLQELDLKNGLALILSTPGGDGLAAERIVNICRAYSGTGDFWAVVPSKAKSAGTIICMGASKILMAPSSELGPVDPQIIRLENGQRRAFSAESLVSLYERLFEEAVQSQGRLEPYLQQLQNFDEREVDAYRAAIKLAEDIAVKALISGHMKETAEDEIREKIQVFLKPDAGTLTHGRAIYAPQAKDSGLPVEDMVVTDDTWRKVYDLYVRLDRFVSMEACKTVESSDEAFHIPAPNFGG